MVGVETAPLETRPERRAFYDELDALVEGMGWAVVGRRIYVRPERDPNRYLGRGQLASLTEELSADSSNVDQVVVAHELRPREVAALTEALPVPVSDRTEVILSIFAARAKSRAGQLQVERARLAYALPRLAGSRQGLSRLGGGVGTRGPGETALEFDRRRIRERITRLDRDLATLTSQRTAARRQRGSLPVVAVVGYTNAGKTTLVGRLTGTELSGVDRLFDTLDPTIRRADLPVSGAVLFVDTVGFVRELPPGLRQAFHATLEEVSAADALLCLVSAASADPSSDYEAVLEVLREIGANQLPRVVALSHSDVRRADSFPAAPLAERPIAVSGVTGEGVYELDQALAEAVKSVRVQLRLDVPLGRAGQTDAWARRHGRVVETEYREDGATLWVEVPAADAARAKTGRFGTPVK